MYYYVIIILQYAITKPLDEQWWVFPKQAVLDHQNLLNIYLLPLIE